MTRTEFTKNLTILLAQMISEGEEPLLDFVKRTPEEQARLYAAGASKCDGVHTISQHQVGKAADILFLSNGQLSAPKKGYNHWHDLWTSMGGEAMIEWDKNHYEVK